MKEIILHGEVSRKFCEKITLEVNTCQEAALGLQANYPLFFSYIVGKAQKGVGFVVTDDDGRDIGNLLSVALIKGKRCHIQPTLAGAGGFGAGMAAFAGGFTQSFLLSWLINKFTKKKEKPDREKMETNSYIYSQAENVEAQGIAVPAGYGQLRIPSKVVSSSITNYDLDWKTSQIYKVTSEATDNRPHRRRAGGVGSAAMGAGREVVGFAGKNVGTNSMSWLTRDENGNVQYFNGLDAEPKTTGMVDTEFPCVQYHHTMGVTGDENGEEINVDEKTSMTIGEGYQGGIVNRSIIFKGNLKDLTELEETIHHRREEAEHLNSTTLYPFDEYKKDIYSQGHWWSMHMAMENSSTTTPT